MVKFCVLGPLRVQGNDGEERTVAGARQQVLLAALLVRAGQVVSTDILAEYLWDGSPPGGARATVQSYVMRLRRQLGPAGGSLKTRPSGYLMDVAEELDLHRFGRLEREGRQAAANAAWQQATSAFAEALALWRGEPLADVPSDALRQEECGRLTEARLAVTELWAEAALRTGQARDVVPELSRLCAAHQYREGMHGLLMTALYRSGRRVDALNTFTAMRNRLIEDIGVEPGPQLAGLHASILADDPALADDAPAESQRAPQPGAPVADGPADVTAVPPEDAVRLAEGPSEPPVVPRQLPGAVRHFTGRADELRALASLIEDGGKVPGMAVITALGGMGGVGKTALAVYWAHQVAAAFPDGQLYVDLRGFSPDAVPVTPAEAVRGFLDALGVPSSRRPASAEAQYALYRSLIADKRLLVLLDNARDASQVRPLLPGTASCVALVTSRRRLTSLAAAEGAHILDLDVFDPPDARELLDRRLGAARSKAQADAMDELVRLCSGLPLALSIAAARAAGRPDRLVSLVDDLRREHDRLAALNAGDPVTDVRAVFSWSLRELDDRAAWMFRVLGLHPGPEISVPAAASVAGYSRGDARRALADLTEAHLLTESSPGRYALHDLLLSYAGEQAGDLPEADRRAAARRMMDHYLHSGFIATQRLEPRRNQIVLGSPAPGVATEALADGKEALDWLQRETTVLVAVARRAAELGFDTEAWQILWTCQQFLHQSGRWQELISSLLTALSAARRTGDQEGQAHMHAGLGLAYSRLGAFDEAQAHLTDALALRTAIHDLDGQINAHLRLSVTYEAKGLLPDALHHARKSLELSRTGENSYVGDALSAVAWCSALCGQFQLSLATCDESMRWYEAIGSDPGRAAVLDTRGYCYQHLGEHDLAIDCFRQSAEICRDVGDKYNEATVLGHLGDAHHDAGARQAARDAWQRALVILEGLGHVAADKMRAKIAASAARGGGTG